MRYLDKDFFARDTLAVARDLIGTVLVVGKCEGRIVETEAYKTDLASHAVTRRNQSRIMQETHGHIYVYLIYGMHYCLNFTTDETGPGAVLIRAAEPLRGIDLMKERRGTDDLHRLAGGPGSLSQAFGIDLSLNHELIGKRLKLRPRTSEPRVVVGERVGISQDVELDWRFVDADSPFVSRPLPKSLRKNRRRGG